MKVSSEETHQNQEWLDEWTCTNRVIVDFGMWTAGCQFFGVGRSMSDLGCEVKVVFQLNNISRGWNCQSGVNYPIYPQQPATSKYIIYHTSYVIISYHHIIISSYLIALYPPPPPHRQHHRRRRRRRPRRRRRHRHRHHIINCITTLYH